MGLQGVPVRAGLQLETAFRINAVRNAFLAEELARILRFRSDDGNPVTPLKGRGFSQNLYGDAAMRVCNDLDTLVPRHLTAPTFQVLLRSGVLLRLRGEDTDSCAVT